MKSPATIKLLVFALLAFFTVNVHATDYYVSASGSNSNNGTSAATPWQTLSKVQSVCNAGTINPGDRILFKRGDAFTGTISIGSIWGNHAKSGTAANPITFSAYGTGAKPVFLYPQGGSTNVTNRITMIVNGVDYYVFDNLNFTDLDTTNDKITPANCGMALYLGAEGEATTNHCTIQNVDVSFCGMGIVLIGDFNKVTGCNLTDFKNLKSTQGGDDDYGANALTIIHGNDNEISNNYIAGAWSASLDYGWNGGACEIFNSCHRNKMLYNTFYDCGGISEFGAYENNASANDNLIAYNKIINCGGLTWCNISGNFAIQVSNLQYFNNVIIENSASRFSGPNTGMGLTAQYQALISPESKLFAYNGSPSASVVFNLKNNVFNLSTGLDVVSNNDPKTAHANNVYKMSGGSTANVTLGATEVNTTAAIFTNTTGADPISWNYTPVVGSPVIDRGQNVGIPKDFVGNPVPTVPNSGILESSGGASTLAATATGGAISCNGGTTTITVAATGGTAPYTGTGTFTVSAGTYNYTVTDGAGATTTVSATVTQPATIAATVITGTITVYGGTTNATVTASGGTGAFTYKLNSGVYQSSNTFTGVAAGSHSVTVKDANGCTFVKSFTLTQPAAPDPLQATSAAGTISCNGGTATVTVSATGGTTPYTGTGTFTVNAGTYTYTVTDAGGVTTTTSVTVIQPSVIAVTVTTGTITVYGGTTSVTANATGGTGAYTYKLNSGSYQSSNTFTAVAAGNHIVTVKDANGCTSVKSFTLTQPGAPDPLQAAATAGTISCNGGSATVTVSATGGTTPYTGTGNFSVSAGTYTYTVTDASGATTTSSITVTQPSAIAVTISAGTIAVNGGTTTVMVSATGGTGAYTYKLNSGSYQSSNTFDNVSAGNHAVTVKDANGCTSVKSFTLTQPAVPDPLQATSTAGTIGCNGGSATVTVSATGGTAPYTGTGSFSVNAGTYSYTVTDASGATITTAITVTQPSAIIATANAGTIAVYGGTTSVTVNATGGTGAYTYKLNSGSYQSSNTFAGVIAGNYTVTVKDANGCTAVATFTLTQPAANSLVVSAVPTAILCNSAISTITVSATGGTAPYTGTGLFTGYAGTYSYTVTDATGASATTTITISQPSAISVTVNSGSITGTGTTNATVVATGGTAPYTYMLTGGTYQTSNTFTGMSAGTYVMNVKDANGCTAVKTFTVTSTTTSGLRISLVAKMNASCRGSNTGAIQVVATGGRAPYTYQLNNGRFTTSPLFKNLRAGVYRVTTKDANGNTASLVVYIFDGRNICSGSTGSGLNGRINVIGYPNPSVSRFNVTITSADESDVTVEVMNQFGTKVFEAKGSVYRTYTFGDNLRAGTYFVRVIQGTEVKTIQVVKGR